MLTTVWGRSSSQIVSSASWNASPQHRGPLCLPEVSLIYSIIELVVIEHCDMVLGFVEVLVMLSVPHLLFIIAP
jgi:hypothetical protein